MTPIQQMMLGLGGASDGDMVDDVFNVNLYTGDGSTTQAKDIGIDLSGEGGLVWVKRRDTSASHCLVDTVRGHAEYMQTNTQGDVSVDSNSIKAFSSTGYTVGSSNIVGANGGIYSSWTFRKAPGFFDVVEYTGNGSIRTISHSLGSVPGMIIVKCTTAFQDWNVYHVGTGATKYLKLNSTDASVTHNNRWNDTAPTATEFTVSTAPEVNSSGASYVAYLFAHNEALFGTGGNNPIVYCGSYTGNGNASGQHLDIGFEPQFFIQKNAGAATGGTWNMFDYVRGVVSEGPDRYFRANTDQTDGSFDTMEFTPTGVQITTDHSNWNASGVNYIYLAIRRSDGKVGKAYTDPTKVFAMATGNSSSTIPNFTSNFPVDMALIKPPQETGHWWMGSRLTQGEENKLSGTDAKSAWSYSVFDSMSGWQNYSGHNSSDQSWMWRRYRGGFDFLTYDGTGSNLTVNHNLGVVPEMIWAKERSNGGTEWKVYHKDRGATNISRLNNDAAEETSQTIFQSTTPTETQFFVQQSLSTASASFMSFLFASVSGISKVGSYSGSGSTVTITTGFQPRYLIIKRTNGTGGWFTVDTTRGWANGSLDKTLYLNSNAAQANDDSGHPTATGFEIYSGDATYNSSGNTYIYYAHA